MKPLETPKIPASKVSEEFYEKLTTPLTRAEVEALAKVPYDSPGPLPPLVAAKLVNLGLLERNQDTKSIVRCTQLGTDVVKRFKKQGWL